MQLLIKVISVNFNKFNFLKAHFMWISSRIFEIQPTFTLMIILLMGFRMKLIFLVLNPKKLVWKENEMKVSIL